MKFFAGIGVVAFLVVASQAAYLKDTDDDGLDMCPDGWSGLVPHSAFCPFYYLCRCDDSPSLRECPSGLYFNPRAEACDLPANVDECVGGTRPPSTQTTTTEQSETEGTMITGPETEATIVTTTSTTTRPSTTTPPADLACPPNPVIFMPYPNECDRYYLCQNGNVISVHSCNAGLWFRFTMQVCMTPWGEDCVE